MNVNTNKELDELEKKVKIIVKKHLLKFQKHCIIILVNQLLTCYLQFE